MNRSASAKPLFWPMFAGLALLYLLLELLVKGPVHQVVVQTLPEMFLRQQNGASRGWAATVDGLPIALGQLDLATDLFLASRGQSREDLAPDGVEAARVAVLKRLIDERLVRSAAQADPVLVGEEVVEERVRQFETRFPPSELNDALRGQDLTRAGSHAILRERVLQQFWLEERAREAGMVSDGDIAQWQTLKGKNLQMPEIVRARHLFLSTVFGDVSAKERLLPELAKQLRDGRATFEKLCPMYSDDDRTKLVGGDLGYFSRDRVPTDFADPVFSQELGKVGVPFRTKIGWHIVRVEERRPAREATREELRFEIATHLENELRPRAVEGLLRELRIAARDRIRIFPPFGEAL